MTDDDGIATTMEAERANAAETEVRRLRAALAEGSSQVGRLMTMVVRAKAAERLAESALDLLDNGGDVVDALQEPAAAYRKAKETP